MADQTQNYSLTKPLETEFYDIGIQNDNMDKIDQALKAQDNALKTHSEDETAHPYLVGKIKTCVETANTASDTANTAASKAIEAATTANKAAEDTNSLADEIRAQRDAGEFKGEKGDKGTNTIDNTTTSPLYGILKGDGAIVDVATPTVDYLTGYDYHHWIQDNVVINPIDNGYGYTKGYTICVVMYPPVTEYVPGLYLIVNFESSFSIGQLEASAPYTPTTMYINLLERKPVTDADGGTAYRTIEAGPHPVMYDGENFRIMDAVNVIHGGVYSECLIPKEIRISAGFNPSIGAPNHPWYSVYANNYYLRGNPLIEAGAYTPYLSNGHANVGCTYEIQRGQYYRIGKLCFFSVRFKGFITQSDQNACVTLPFPPDISQVQRFCFSLGEVVNAADQAVTSAETIGEDNRAIFFLQNGGKIVKWNVTGERFWFQASGCYITQ